MFSLLAPSWSFHSLEQSNDVFLTATTARLVFDHPSKTEAQLKKFAQNILKTQQVCEDTYSRNLADVLPLVYPKYDMSAIYSQTVNTWARGDYHE